MNENISFFIPFFYTYNTRLMNVKKLMSWMVIYFIPVFCSAYFSVMSVHGVINMSMAKYCLVITFAITNLYNLYEIGYIQNDTETIKNEKKPTLRLSENQLSFYFKNRKKIYCIRIFLSIFFTYIFAIYKLNVLFICGSWLISLFFLIYNKIRNRFNLLVHFFLVVLRYCLVSSVFYFNWILFLFLIVVFPILNTIERSAESRFNYILFQKIIRNYKDKFRYIYYFTLIILSCFLYLIYGEQLQLVMIFYSLFYFSYRFLTSKFGFIS